MRKAVKEATKEKRVLSLLKGVSGSRGAGGDGDAKSAVWSAKKEYEEDAAPHEHVNMVAMGLKQRNDMINSLELTLKENQTERLQLKESKRRTFASCREAVRLLLLS